MFGGTRALLGNQDYSALHQLSENEHKLLQQSLLEIAVDVQKFCENHHLICMLCGGSGIGAARHQGFIPWDDDLDMAMFRKDYIYFSENFEKEYGHKYKIYAPLGKHNATHLFMKVSKKRTILEDMYTAGSKYRTGVAIDIFPIENVPVNKLHQRLRAAISDVFAYAVVSDYLYENNNEKLKSVYETTLKRKTVYRFRLILGRLMSFRGYQWWYRKFDSFSGGYRKTGLYTIPTGRGHYIGEIQPEATFLPVRKTKFENEQLYFMADEKTYLSKLYGDYMKIPPENKRERHYYTKVKM